MKTFGYFRPTKIAHLREAQALLEAAALRLEQARLFGDARRDLGFYWKEIDNAVAEKDPALPRRREIPRCFGRPRGIAPWMRDPHC